MAKLDITMNVKTSDRLLATMTNPRHRRILSNYRRHALLEVSGVLEQIFEPEMTVAKPYYNLNNGLFDGSQTTREAILDTYKLMRDLKLNVIVVENEKIIVGDQGFGHEADFHQYLKGADAMKYDPEQDLEPESWYRIVTHVIGIWWYDEECRLLGEFGSQMGKSKYIKIPEDEVITPQEAHDKLMPLLNELPPLPSELQAAE